MLYVSNSTHNRLSFNAVLGEQGSHVSLFFLSNGNLLSLFLHLLPNINSQWWMLIFNMSKVLGFRLVSFFCFLSNPVVTLFTRKKNHSASLGIVFVLAAVSSILTFIVVVLSKLQVQKPLSALTFPVFKFATSTGFLLLLTSFFKALRLVHSNTKGTSTPYLPAVI